MELRFFIGFGVALVYAAGSVCWVAVPLSFGAKRVSALFSVPVPVIPVPFDVGKTMMSWRV